MKRLLGVGLALGFVALASNSSFAATSPLNKSENGHTVHIMPTRTASASTSATTSAAAGAPTSAPVLVSNASYHGSKVLVTPKVVPIFWGWYWKCAEGAAEKAKIISFLEQYGTNREFNTITQYYDTAHGATQYIWLNTLTHSYDAIDDCSCPPENVTDDDATSEILDVVPALDPNVSTVYELFLPPGSYSSMGGYTSCGGNNLAYCAYHGYYVQGCAPPPTAPTGRCESLGPNFVYAVIPYPTCYGCQYPGWCNTQNIDQFITHETREAVTHPYVDTDFDYIHDGWFDGTTGGELDDKCAWMSFLDGGYGYQMEWSNLNKGCIKWR